jgi:hypothetical protein
VVTAAQVKTYLQPLIDENDDLVLIGRLLVVKPVHHVLRAVLVERFSWAEGMRPQWLIHHMFGPHPSYHIGWGHELRARVWNTTDPDTAEALRHEIQENALPILRSIVTLGDFVAAVPSTFSGHLWTKDPEGKSLIDIAMGDLDSARVMCQDKICNRPDPGLNEADVTKAEAAGAKALCRLLELNDVEGMVRTLHDWERRNVKMLKFEKFWQPTPFPIEEKLGLNFAHSLRPG